MKEYASQFREIRKRHGVSQRNLCKKTGIMPCTICRFENGKQDITMKTAIKIAKALKDDDLINLIQQSIISQFD